MGQPSLLAKVAHQGKQAQHPLIAAGHLHGLDGFLQLQLGSALGQQRLQDTAQPLGNTMIVMQRYCAVLYGKQQRLVS